MTIVHAAIRRSQIQSPGKEFYTLAWNTVYECDKILGTELQPDFYFSFEQEPSGFAASFRPITGLGVADCINIDLFKVSETQQFQYLIAHEFCHLLQNRNHPREAFHGPYWRKLMNQLGYQCDNKYGTLLENNSKLTDPTVDRIFEWAPRDDRFWAYICERCATHIKGPKDLNAVCNSCEAPFVPITD